MLGLCVLRPARLCIPMHCSLPASSVHGISQARILEWALPFPPPGDLPDPGTEPGSLVLQAHSLPSEPPGNPYILIKPMLGT